MKSTGSTLAGVLILAIGVILIICHNSITAQGIVVLAGILFLLTGIVNLIIYVTRRDEEGRLKTRGIPLFFGWLVSIAAIILGLCMLVFDDTFKPMIPFIFALLVMFGAVMQTYSMAFVMRKVVKPQGWMWLFPVVMVGLAIAVAVQPVTTADPTIMLLTGIAIIVFGVGCMAIGVATSTARRDMARKVASAPADASRRIEDVKADGED